MLGGQELFILLLFLIGFILWILVLVDIIKSEFMGYNKVIWIILILLLPFPGIILYWIIGRKQKIE